MSKKLKIFEELENLKNFLSKKIIIIICMLLIVQMASATLVGTTAGLKITSLKYEPYPVEQGQYFKMWVQLENVGVEKADNVSFKIMDSYPFSIDEDPIRVIGKLDEGDDIVLEYKIKVDADAVTGTNQLSAKYCIKNGLCMYHDFDITVKTRDAIIAVADVSTTPDEIAPGEEAILTIKLSNTADSLMKDIRVKLDIYEKLTTAASITYNELPFTPKGSTNEVALSSIKKGETKEVEFRLIADPNAVPDIYKIPIIITYADEIGTNYTRNYVTALIINDEPNLYGMIEETTVPNGGGTGTINVRFINKGLSDVKFLDVKLKESKDYDILSSEMVYIGNLDSDDYETAEFKIKTKSKEDTIDLLLGLEYRDAINNQYRDEMKVPLSLENSSSNGQSKFGVGQIIFILVMVAVAVFFFLRWRKCKKKKK